MLSGPTLFMFMGKCNAVEDILLTTFFYAVFPVVWPDNRDFRFTFTANAKRQIGVQALFKNVKTLLRE